MKRISITLLCFSVGFIASCNFSDPSEIEETPLVINVYDFNNDLVAHYEYDESQRLIKREFTDPVNNTSSDLFFHYENDLVDIIEYVDYDFPQFSHEKHYFYNDKSKIDKIETYKKGQIISTFSINYSSDGLVESFYSAGEEPPTTYEYDLNKNIIKTTHYFTNPWDDQELIQECEFEYDGKKKANFGLDYLIGMELLPWRGTTSTWQQTLSRNNIVSESCSGHEYTIEYDQNDNPRSITTKWKDIETETPMTIWIEYKTE